MCGDRSPAYRFVTRAVARTGLVALVAATLLTPGTLPAHAESQTAADPIPLLAYYYIWYNPTSWNRAKTDYPLLGRYSSDEVFVMRQQVDWAQQAGIDGFVVSWKSTPILNARLSNLIDVAGESGFKLEVTYQGLDFFRRPLPVRRVLRDLRYFADRFAGSPAFNLFGPPVIIWSGTWEYSRRQVQIVTDGIGERLQILASEHSPEDYERVADLVAGDAYYWSSVNPKTYPAYQEKLDAMSSAVHSHGGLWIAPAAPGFDARLVGGSTVVPREAGETLRAELAAATRSSPDAVGLISWNEFSENTHVEPSERYGSQALDVIADVRSAPRPVIPDFDSNGPSGFSAGPASIGLLACLILVSAASLLAIARRRHSYRPSHAAGTGPPVPPRS